MQIDNLLLINTINNLKKSYLSKKLILLEYYNHTIISMLQNSSNYILELNSVLIYSKDILDTVSSCIKKCDFILELLEKNTDNTQEIDKLFNEIINYSTKIDKLLKDDLLKTVPLLNSSIIKEQPILIANANTNNVQQCNEISKNLIDNNVLLISEKKSKVFLPYKISDLKEILKTNTLFNNLEDLINTNYTIPLENYQNSVVARFKEAFSLIKDKENRKCVFSYRIRTRTSI